MEKDVFDAAEETEVFGMDKAKLQITMLGDFVLTYNNQVLKLERTNTTKAMQVLQMLLFYGTAGVPRDTLLDTLYQDDSATEPANNLKVTVSNLRKLLIRAGLPEGTTVVFHSGNYYWQCEENVAIDAKTFESEVKKASTAAEEKVRVQHWKNACALYRGDFLPHLQSEGWAAAAAAYYREMYFSCVNHLIETLKADEQAEELLPFVTRAAALYGLEEFQLGKIDCLMRLHRYAEAKQEYEETVRGLRDDFDLGPSEALLNRCRQLDSMLSDRSVSIQDLQDTLREDSQEKGAYYCAFPGFIDVYRAVERMLQRMGQSAYLLLCCMTDSQGKPVTSKEKLADATPKVSEAIRCALRRGDLYTQPARDRFLVLLVGTNRENCSLITDRILNRYKKNAAHGVGLSFRLAPVTEVMNLEMFQQKPTWE